MEEKDFDGWIKVKEKLHYAGRIRSVNVGMFGGMLQVKTLGLK